MMNIQLKRRTTHAVRRSLVVAGLLLAASASFATSQISMGFENSEGYVIPRAPFLSYAADSVHQYPAGPGDSSWWVAPNSTPFTHFDQAVTSAAAKTGTQSFYYSNSNSNGVIQQILSPKVSTPVGEPGTVASNGPASGNTRFVQQFWVRTASNVVERGNRFTMSADDGNGGRMNWFGLEPTTDGTPRYQFWLVDYVPTSFDGGWEGFGEGDFRDEILMDNVAPGTWYHVKIVTDIKPGRGNDEVRYYIGTSANLTEADLKGVGTTWEEYFRQGGELAPQNPNAINCTLIRSGATPQQWDSLASATTTGFYFDDFSMQSTSTPGGMPVDLNGSYQAVGSDAVNVITGFGSATTDPDGDRNGQGQVYASASGVIAAENTFTPFSDALKAPASLQNLDLRGKSFEAELDMGSVSSWNDPFPGFGNDLFQLGLGRQTVQANGTEESYVFAYRNNTHFSLYYNTNWTVFGTPGQTYDADPAATKFHVRVDFNAAGTQATMTVTPLDGPDAGQAVELDPVALDGSDIVNNASFFAGFINSTGGEESGRVVVSNFRTDATTNSQYVFSSDPYNKSTENAIFALGQANLSAPVGGFMSFLNSTTLAGTMGFVSGSYTEDPYPTGNFFGPITGAGNLAGGILVNTSLTQGNWTLANILMSGTNGTRGRLGINANNGGGLDSQFNDFDGNAIIANRQGSNVALWDDVAPVFGAVTATQGVNNALVAPGVQTGPLAISIIASDALTGLDSQPSISIDFAPIGAGPEDVALRTFSMDGNRFGANYTVPANAPNGAGQIVFSAVDRAGNSVTQLQPINVNTATLTLNIQLQGFAAAGSVTRGVEIILGGSGGSNGPITLSRDVTFNNTGFATVVFDSGDGIPNTSNVTEYLIGVKDPLHTLRSTVAVTGTGNQYVATASAVRGGNLNGDNKIDIGDYVVYATRFGVPVSPSTPFPHAPTFRHADISGDGVVDTADFSFIAAGFATQFDNPAPGNFGREDRTIRRRITVIEAIKESGSRQAQLMDLNRDGVITMEEAQRYISRLR